MDSKVYILISQIQKRKTSTCLKDKSTHYPPSYPNIRTKDPVSVNQNIYFASDVKQKLQR